MLSITHIATGAGIAHLAPNPLIYIPLTLASHYILDALPHWDCGTGLGDGSKSKKDAVFQELFELALSFLFLLIITKSNLFEWQMIHLWVAAFVSLIPDFLEAPENFFNWNPRLLKVFNDFHEQFHSSVKDMKVGLTPQIIYLFLIYLFI